MFFINTQIICILFLFVIKFNNCSFLNYIIPFYKFELHPTPLIFTNTTNLKQEMTFYDNMKKYTVIHVAGSTLATVTMYTTFCYLTPIPVIYWSYHLYMFHKSSHMEQQCKFHINEKEDDRFKTGNKWYDYNIPEFIFSPILFCLTCWGFIIIFTVKYGISKKLFIIILFIFYTYSFFQQIKDSIDRLTIKRDIIKRQLTYECNILRMSYRRRITKNIYSFFGMQTDKLGYLVNDKQCKQLEIDLYSLDESFIDILFKTFTKSILTIFKELYFSISTINKITILCSSFLFYKIIKYVNFFGVD